ncbi:transposase [Nonomuraea sp. NPDC005983]|uniref:transposase n=1 Tax=Nonomuraea sp. NPDC005983 TaxID=3155595 RepID=UPI0033AA6B9A
MAPATCYRTAIRRALPHAVVVVDHFHLIALANEAVWSLSATCPGSRNPVPRLKSRAAD